MRLEDVLNGVIRATGIDIINDNTRLRVVVDARIVYGFIARQLCGKGYHKIGKLIGKNHATIIHYEKQARNFIEVDKDFEDLYYKCLAEIKVGDVNVLESCYQYHLRKANFYKKKIA